MNRVGAGVALIALAGWGCGPVGDIDLNDGLNAVTNPNNAVQSTVGGAVADNRGGAVAGATIALYDLVTNTSFVEGGDVQAQEAYIDRAAILQSNNALATAVSAADGTYSFEGIFPSALLVVATKEGCTAGFAGFDEETGVLNVDTLILPDANLDFAVPNFVLACATPPENLGPAGNSDGAPAFEPEATPATCDATLCEAAGGACNGADCVLGCATDADCQAGQPGGWCDTSAAPAECRAPLPGEIVPVPEASNWTSFTVTDTDDALLADASEANQALAVAEIPPTGLARVRGTYTGDATVAYVHVQTGGQGCPDAAPKTDHFAVEVVDGAVTGEIYLHGGYQKVMLSTSDVLGDGEQSFFVEVGEPCAPPAHPFVAIMSWDAGPSQPADLDLNVWNGAGELVFVGSKQAAWGQLSDTREGPGPEIFWGDDTTQGPFTIKAQFFSGRPRSIEGKLRLLRVIDGQLHDDSFVFTVERPKDVAEIGVFPAE